MVRLLYTLVTVSLLLNLYAIWQLEQLHSTEIRVLEGARGSESGTKHGNESAPPPAKPALASARELVDLLSTVRDLTGRVESLEKNANSLQADTVTGTGDGSQPADIASDWTGRFNFDDNDDDWFWHAPDGEVPSLSFSATDQFDVHSMACRAGWCRVEIEAYGYDEESENATQELHLKINESLGRDTVIRWGEKDGSRRVVFIR